MNRDLSNFNEWASEIVRFRDSETVKTARTVDDVPDVLEDICAFANAGKGTVYFGVDENGFAVGDPSYKKKPKKLMTAIFLHISPPLFPRIQVRKIDGRDVVCTEIVHAPDRPYFLDGKYFKRMGSSNLSLFPHEIKIFMHSSKSLGHFDSRVIPAYPGSINQERFDWYLSKVDFRDLYAPNVQFDEHEIMQKLGILSHNKMNTAAILCFGVGIYEIFPQASIICQRVDGTDEAGTVIKNEKIIGDLFSQIKAAEKFISQNMTQTIRSGDNWEEKKQVIAMVMGELMLESIIHRDYSMADPIAILIFNDHIELIIPGNLIKWYVDKTKTSDGVVTPPNPMLAKLFFLSGYLSHWLPSVAYYDDILDEYNLPFLEFLDHKQYMGVLLRWERKKTGTALSYKEETPVYGVSGESPISQEPLRKDSYTTVILQFCRTPKTRIEIQEFIKIKDRKHFRQSILKPILEKKLLAMTIPGKPNSPRQQYKTTARGEQLLVNL